MEKKIIYVNLLAIVIFCFVMSSIATAQTVYSAGGHTITMRQPPTQQHRATQTPVAPVKAAPATVHQPSNLDTLEDSEAAWGHRGATSGVSAVAQRPMPRTAGYYPMPHYGYYMGGIYYPPPPVILGPPVAYGYGAGIGTMPCFGSTLLCLGTQLASTLGSIFRSNGEEKKKAEQAAAAQKERLASEQARLAELKERDATQIKLAQINTEARLHETDQALALQFQQEQNRFKVATMTNPVIATTSPQANPEPEPNDLNARACPIGPPADPEDSKVSVIVNTVGLDMGTTGPLEITIGNCVQALVVRSAIKYTVYESTAKVWIKSGLPVHMKANPSCPAVESKVAPIPMGSGFANFELKGNPFQDECFQNLNGQAARTNGE